MANAPDKGIDLDWIYIIQLLYSLFDLMFICLDVYNKNKRICLFNLFHGAFRVERIFNDSIVIETWFGMDCFSLVFRSSREFESFWTMKSCWSADFLGFCGVIPFKCCLFGRLGLFLVVCYKLEAGLEEVWERNIPGLLDFGGMLTFERTSGQDCDCVLLLKFRVRYLHTYFTNI